MLTWMLLHDTVTSWVELHDWVWFLALVMNASTMASSYLDRRYKGTLKLENRYSDLTPEQQKLQAELARLMCAELALEEKMLKAARSFHFGVFRVEWCGDHPVTLEPRYCVKHVWNPSYRYRLDGTDEYEPMPSERDDAFLERANFPREVAVGLAMRLNEENDRQAAAERAAGEEDT